MNCTCPDNAANTGTVNCLTELKDVIKMIAVPTFANDGTRNKILLTTTLNQAWLDALINHADPSKRYYPIGEFENVSDARADNVTEEAASGKIAFIKHGIRSFSAEFWEKALASPQFNGVLNKMKCTKMSVFFLDREFNLIGTVLTTEDGYFYPIRLDNNSWNAKYVPATPTSIAKNVLSFNIHPDERDELIRWIVPSEYTADLIGSMGLLDIYAEITSCSTTVLVFKLFNRYGTAKTKQPLTGLLITDFFDVAGGTASRLYNVTDSLAVVITGVTENPDGTYRLTYAAQTVADVIRITPVKNGYDFTEVIAETATVA